VQSLENSGLVVNGSCAVTGKSWPEMVVVNGSCTVTGKFWPEVVVVNGSCVVTDKFRPEVDVVNGSCVVTDKFRPEVVVNVRICNNPTCYCIFVIKGMVIKNSTKRTFKSMEAVQ